jgi:hypothetical protein
MWKANIRWGLCILCVLLIGALITSYYLQIKKIRAIHETVISIFAGMVVGLIIRLSPGHVIREMLVSHEPSSRRLRGEHGSRLDSSDDPAEAESLVIELICSHSNILSSLIYYYRQSS